MIATTIKGKACNTIKDFYTLTVPKIKYSQNSRQIRTVADFYDEFLIEGNRLLQKNIVEEWHKLLVWYIDQSDAPLFVRKYEAGKENKEWNNRRGAVVRFDDGFEIVYASNFLAHDIFLMAYHGFVPSKEDFLTSAKNRTLHITSGTEAEKKIRLYNLSNKGLLYCYLAHIMDVNGQYLREDGSYKELSKAETEWIFPRGTALNWTNSPDKIWHIPCKLSAAEQELVRAHCLRFLDPMNYYLTPLTKHCTHSIPGFKKNIGEYPYLTYYIQQQYRAIYGQDYDELVERGRFVEEMPKGYTQKEKIDLEYSEKKESDTVKAEDATGSVPAKAGACAASEDFIYELGDFMRRKSKLSEKSVRIYLGRIIKLLESGYSVGDLCGGIDTIIEAHSAGGKNYDEKDSGNTRAALAQIKKRIGYLYITYNSGYQSFVPMDEHLVGYCIDGNTITVSKKCGFVSISETTKKIPKKHMEKLISLVEEARKQSLFEKSDSCICTEHGLRESYDYSYGASSGENLCGLFKNDRLQSEYDDLIAKLIK